MSEERSTEHDGVGHSLPDEEGLDLNADGGRLGAMAAEDQRPTVVEVLRFEDLPAGSLGTRRAVVRWSDGTEGEALHWYSEEVLVCEGDLVDKTQDAIRSLHFRRDRDWLQS